MNFSRIIFTTIFVAAAMSARAQVLPNPILFTTQIPTPKDTITMSEVFASHLAGMQSAPRGGDLYIRYTDGTVRNLTQAAGYGVASGLQGAKSIAVREPCVFWDGTRALFSMVIGGATHQGDTTRFVWQIFEITNFAKGQTPIITQVSGQPANYNNVAPIYGTDDRVIFVSDRPRNDNPKLYPLFDEYKLFESNTGLYSLDPSTGDLRQLDHSPSGDFTPFIDSYGRLIFTRWDHLQRDATADRDALGTGNFGTFNYTGESDTSVAQFGVRDEVFPEPQGSRTDLLAGTNMLGFEFNQFFPWTINEDGTQEEIVNHIGRHELRFAVGRNITDDPNVVSVQYSASGRANQNFLSNFLYPKEDPNTPGLYYGVDAGQDYVHGGGQILSLTLNPTLDPNQSVLTYINNKACASPTQEGQTPNANHAGFYRNPVPLTNGALIAVHTVNTFADKNLGTRGNPVSRYDYRLKTLKKSGSYFVPDQNLTPGISKTVSYWDPDTLVNFSGTLWEMDPVEVRARTRPARRFSTLPAQEQQVFTDEGVDANKFKLYLANNKLALFVSRDVTHRDAADRQQPYYLRIAGTTKQSANASGKIYDVAHIQFLEGEHRRGIGLTTPGGKPAPGRRVIATVMHDVVNPPNPGGPVSSVKLADDGSWSAFVPAQRAMTWQITDAAGKPVVRERYWVTSGAGEIRVCASCHGTNDAATAPINPIPQNKPAALAALLRDWKSRVLPAAAALIAPPYDSAGVTPDYLARWHRVNDADRYHFQVATDTGFTGLVLDQPSLTDTSRSLCGLKSATQYFWRVAPGNQYGSGAWSTTWRFTTTGVPTLASPPDNALSVNLSDSLSWDSHPDRSYHLQVSTVQDFSWEGYDGGAGPTPVPLSTLNLVRNQKYFWRVKDDCQTDWSATWSFTTVPTVPATVSLIAPTNNATNIPTATTLIWDSVASSASYHVQLTKTGSGVLVTDTVISATSRAVKGLDSGTTYQWQVQAKNGTGYGPWSPTWKFTTVPPVPTAVHEQSGLPLLACLVSIAPNPFGNAATIEFTMNATQRASIGLFNAIGQHVAVIADGTFATGSHRIDWRAEDIPAGVYFVRLTAGASVDTRAVRIVR